MGVSLTRSLFRENRQLIPSRVLTHPADEQYSSLCASRVVFCLSPRLHIFVFRDVFGSYILRFNVFRDHVFWAILFYGRVTCFIMGSDWYYASQIQGATRDWVPLSPDDFQ